MNEALITVRGCSIDDPETGTKITTRGACYRKKDVYYIFYEVLDDEMPGVSTKHKLQIHPDYVKISYSGGMNQSFVLKPGMECESVYTTPYGEFDFIFVGREQRFTEDSGRLHLYLRYDIFSAGALLSENELELHVEQ